MIELTNLGFLSTLLISSITVVQEAGSVLPCKQPSLIWHNHFRRIHQVANVTWSDKLWEKAARWASYLAAHNKFYHEKNDPGNLFLSPGRPPEPCARAVKLFYEEEKNYNYKKPQYYRNAAHFTQLVWKNTKQIGAASKVRKDGKTVVVVKYFPPGNVGGYYAQNVFPPRKTIVTARTPGNFTVTKPNLFVRAGISSLVWKNTKQIGAASKVRKDGKTVVVVKYFPPGNVGGYYAQNVFPPGKPIVTTLTPVPNVTTAGNVTSRNFTVTKPNLFVRAGISSVNGWRAAHFAVQWLFVVFVIFY